MKTKLFLAGRLMLCAIAVAALGSGCEVTSEKLQAWKQSVKGAAKIRAAVRDQDQSQAIRVEAAEALCEMGLFIPLADDFKALTDADRKTIFSKLVQRLLGKMSGSNPGATTRVQIRAKDALFSLRPLADEPLRRTIDEKVVRWLVADWQKRGSGEHSAEKVVKAVGQASGPALTDALGNGTPVLIGAALLRQVASQGERDRAAAKLVQLAAQQKPPRVETFHALGKVGSLAAVKYLLQVVQRGPFQQRLWSLRALALYPRPAAVDVAAAIAGDASLKDDQAVLRDEAFTLLEKIGSPASLQRLANFLEDKKETVRYRAAEAMLSGFGVQGVTKLLEALPSRYAYKKQDLVDFIEKDIQELGKSVRPVLRGALGSKSWVARLIAVRVLGEIGTKQDVTALEKLGSDRTRLRGWDGGATVGSEALSAAKRLKER